MLALPATEVVKFLFMKGIMVQVGPRGVRPLVLNLLSVLGVGGQQAFWWGRGRGTAQTPTCVGSVGPKGTEAGARLRWRWRRAAALRHAWLATTGFRPPPRTFFFARYLTDELHAGPRNREGGRLGEWRSRCEAARSDPAAPSLQACCLRLSPLASPPLRIYLTEFDLGVVNMQGYGVDVLDRDESKPEDGARKSGASSPPLALSPCSCHSAPALGCADPHVVRPAAQLAARSWPASLLLPPTHSPHLHRPPSRSRLQRRGGCGDAAAAAARGDGHGACGSRQDLAARLHPQDAGGGGRGGGHHPGADVCVCFVLCVVSSETKGSHKRKHAAPALRGPLCLVSLSGEPTPHGFESTPCCAGHRRLHLRRGLRGRAAPGQHAA